jgi:molecular chaperone DnaK (HSP70)
MAPSLADLKRRLGHSPAAAALRYLHVIALGAADTPVRVGDQTYPPNGLLARMLADRIAELTAEQQELPPAQLVLSHPTRWSPATAAALRTAADPLAAPGTLHLVPHAIAAAVAYAVAHPVPDGAAVLVCDVGATTDEVFVVRRRGDDLAVLAPPARPPTGGGDTLDDAVVRLVDTHLNGAADDLDAPPVQTQIAAARLWRDCRAVKESLSTATTAELTAHLPGGPVSVCLTRAELDRAIRPIATVIGDAVRACLQQVDPGTVRAVVLTGGCSHLPALQDKVRAAAGEHPVHIDAHAAARGAAALGAAELNTRPGRTGQPAERDVAPPDHPLRAAAGPATGAALLPTAGDPWSTWCALDPSPAALPRLPARPPVTANPQ